MELSCDSIKYDGFVLYFHKPFIGAAYCKTYYLSLTEDGYLIWKKCPCSPTKGVICVRSVVDRIRVSRMNPCKILDCVKIKELQPSTLFVLQIPMIVKSKLEKRSFIVGEQKQLHMWLDALLGTISDMVPSLARFAISGHNNSLLFNTTNARNRSSNTVGKFTSSNGSISFYNIESYFVLIALIFSVLY